MFVVDVFPILAITLSIIYFHFTPYARSSQFKFMAWFELIGKLFSA